MVKAIFKLYLFSLEEWICIMIKEITKYKKKVIGISFVK